MTENTQYIEYITKDGDRWDLIAYQFLGDATLYELIIVANPLVPIFPILPAGIPLQIPDINDEEMTTTEDLPPWKR
jgi:phage tail protein X